MFYKITPFDTLFFRDGRPFTIGAETWANSIFPPYPSTVYGAIRTWIIFEKGTLRDFKEGKFKEEIGLPPPPEKEGNSNELKEECKGTLKLYGPIICLKNILRFPLPKDLLKKKSSKDENYLFPLSSIKKPDIFISDYKLANILINKNDFELEEAEGFLDMPSIIDYLEGKNENLKLIPKSEIFIIEPKIGIKRNKITLSSEKDHLYRAPMIRLQKETSLFVQVEGLKKYPEKGIIQLGGEGKTAKIEKCTEDLLKELREVNFEFKNKIFKLYLLTPAIFQKGWLPYFIDEANFQGNKEGIELELIGCSLGKYVSIGGWDLINKEPKPMYKAVPAGSVYYFKILNNTYPEKIKEVFHLKSISDIKPEEGFGLALVGEV